MQFVRGLRTLYEAGARVFVEVGPKKALHGFAEDVLGASSDVLALFTNHPKYEDTLAFNQALCGLYAAGLGTGRPEMETESGAQPERGRAPDAEPVVITGAALGLPGPGRIFDDENVARILNGEQFIDVIPTRFRRAMLDKHITRLVKTDNGGPVFEEISHPSDVIKLAGRGGAFDLETEFGIPAERIAALDRCTRLAIAAGLDALRDAGIPLAMRYKSTSKGTRLPERWGLPDELRDSTGVIFASVFPGFDAFADEAERYYTDRGLREQLAMLEDLRTRNGHDGALGAELDRRIAALRDGLARSAYHLDRRFLFRVLSMGHSQFAELIGARGPNTQLNAACASTTQAVAVAEDWIRTGRCRRVVVVSADDVTSDRLHRMVRRGISGQRRGGHRRRGRGNRDSLRPAPQRHDHRNGRGGAGHRKRRSRRRTRPAPHLRSAERGNGQQRVPRHAAGHRAHRQAHGGTGPAGRDARRHPPRGDGRVHGFRFARDLHARARRQRGGRNPCPAPGVRPGGGPHRHRQHQGLHRPRHGRGH